MTKEIVSRHLAGLSFEKNLDNFEAHRICNHNIFSTIFFILLVRHKLIESLYECVVLGERIPILYVEIAVEKVGEIHQELSVTLKKWPFVIDVVYEVA